jgi:MFS family permease
VIAGRTVLGLGLAQLILWDITCYLIGGFGDAMTADLGVSRDAVYGGFSAALLVMALASPLAGRWIDRRGGRLRAGPWREQRHPDHHTRHAAARAVRPAGLRRVRRPAVCSSTPRWAALGARPVGVSAPRLGGRSSSADVAG